MITSRTKILIVDDDFSSRRLVERFIRNNWTCAVVQAEDGSQALREMLHEAPSLVILDMVMPFMSGMDVLKTMRSTAKLAKIPVLACTSVGDNHVVKEAIEYGVVDYIVKPVSEKTLVKKLTNIFKHIN